MIIPKEDILALIPARAGSKGIKGKNIAPFAGKPLIAQTISVAAASKNVARVIVSTDGVDIADVSRQYGAEVPFLRPPELAQDTTPGIDPVIHAVEWLAENENYFPEYIMLLQPTSPLRTVEDIDAAISIATSESVDSVVSVAEVKQHPYWTLKIESNSSLSSFLGLDLLEMQQKYPRRQDLPKAYAENGAIYLVRRSVLLKSRSFYGKNLRASVMPGERSLDIDTSFDLRIAEQIITERENRTNN